MKIKLSALFFIALIICGLASCDAVKSAGKAMLRRGHVKAAKVDTGLPVIKITTKSGAAVTSKDDYITAGIEIIDPLDSGSDIKTEVDIRGRGNTSWNSPKKSYRIKFPQKTALFGYTPAKSWVLLANYQDTTLILNSSAFELGSRFNVPFTPHYTHVELFLNGVYDGSYVLTEQIQTGKGRVDIDKDGFLVEIDSHYDEEPKFQTPILEMPVMIKHPEDLPGDSGYDFVKNAVNELETALFSDPFPNTHYLDLINIDVFVDYIMINEITRNADIQLPHSVYLYKDGKKDSRICLGPLWDFDYGFDYSNTGGRFWSKRYFNDATGMYYTTTFRNGQGQRFFARFFEDPVFREKYKKRWNEKYGDIAGMEEFFDQTAAMLEASQKLNSRVWWWKRVNYKKEIERMKAWWKKRVEYLNDEINRF
ncbi:MAG: CotH kinase family protein [Treponema sp.]|jgi:spore coat protein CotH|nr:CotH kinase family protein [Treponema sp.]